MCVCLYVVVCIGDVQRYALKVMHKETIVSMHQEKNVYSERDILREVSHDFIVQLFGTYSDATRLYMLMELVPAGDVCCVGIKCICTDSLTHILTHSHVHLLADSNSHAHKLMFTHSLTHYRSVNEHISVCGNECMRFVCCVTEISASKRTSWMSGVDESIRGTVHTPAVRAHAAAAGGGGGFGAAGSTVVVVVAVNVSVSVLFLFFGMRVLVLVL